MSDVRPVDRLQSFLAAIAGDESAPELTPRDQLEYYLAKMAERVDNIQPGPGPEPGWQDGVAYAPAAYLPVTSDAYIKTDGTTTSYGGWDITAPVNCAGAAKLTNAGNSFTVDRYSAFYAADGTFLRMFNQQRIPGDANSVAVPEGAAYFRISGSRAFINYLQNGEVTITPYAEV